MENSNTFNWCGCTWKSQMDGGRIIHPTYPWYWYSSSDNVLKRDKNDMLELFIKKNPKDVKHWDGNIYHPTYEVATIRSVEDFGYGTFSCKMMMPTGKNISASFWLSGSGNWPPEIDIEEGFLEGDKGWFRWTENYFPYLKPSWRTTTNVHFRDDNMNKTHIGSRNISYLKQSKDPSENWIEYKCTWKPNLITFYANDKVVRTVTGKECKQLTQNIKDPEKGWKVNVIFNVWLQGDPEQLKPDMVHPMLIKEFVYKPLQ